MEQPVMDSPQTCCWYVMRFCLICTGNTQWLFGGDGYCILKFLPSSTSLGQWCCHLAWSCSVPICLVWLLLCLPARSWCHICPSYCVTCSSGMLPTILLFFLVIWLCMVLYPMMCLILLMWWCLPDSLSWIDAGNPVLYLHPHGWGYCPHSAGWTKLCLVAFVPIGDPTCLLVLVPCLWLGQTCW